MKAATGCLVWLALYALVSFALYTVVERRLGQPEPAYAASLIGGLIAVVALSHLARVARRIRELLLIRGSLAGAEPEDGKAFAAIGTITPDHGSKLIPGLIRSGVLSLRAVANVDAKIETGAIKTGDVVCAIGRYSMEQRALVLDTSPEPGERVTGRRIAGIGGGLMNAIVLLAIVTAGLAALYTIVPLDAVERADISWTEIGVEDFVDNRLRVPLTQAGMPLFVQAVPGSSLQAGEARGRIRSGPDEVSVTSAAAQAHEDHLDIIFSDGGRPVGTIALSGSAMTGLRLLSEDITPEEGRNAKLVLSRPADDEMAGRLSLIRDGVPVCRVVFRVQVPAGGV